MVVFLMDEHLKELFFNEVDQGRLRFEACPEYNELMAQSEALFPAASLPKPVFRLLDLSNRLSFAHGFRLGLRLKRWAGL